MALLRALAILALLPVTAAAAPRAAPSREYQIKAGFLFNFIRFVDWPPGAFPDANAPLVIGILGEDPFGPFLDDMVGGQTVNGRPLVVERFRSVDEISACHILYISRSEAGRLDEILARLKGRNILTVGDANAFALHGGVIGFATESNRTRLKINLEAARTADLTISSKLLRPAEIVGTGKD